MASIDNSGGQGIGDTLNAVREQVRSQNQAAEQASQQDTTPRVERDVLSLSPEALARQSQLQNASLIGAGSDSQRLISFLR